jgi:signal transduction histidine kinase
LVDGVAEPSERTLVSLKDEILRLARVVEDLEIVASARSAGLSLERRTVDLSLVAARAADAMEASFRECDLELIRALEPVAVVGDANRLQQVIVNLLANAIKFTPAGGRVGLTVDTCDHRARVLVTDTGVGIPANELPHVFERFWRGSGTQSFAGSGIGLAVVSELVGAHGGEMSVTSDDGQGTTFVVLLPVGSAEPAFSV